MANKTVQEAEQVIAEFKGNVQAIETQAATSNKSLLYRRGKKRRTQLGPLKDLIREADRFWVRHKGKRIGTKSEDPDGWSFHSTLVAIVEPKINADTLRKNFFEYSTFW